MKGFSLLQDSCSRIYCSYS